MSEYHFDQSGRSTSPVAKFLMEHDPVMQRAHREYADAGEGNVGALAALRYLTEQLKPIVSGVSANDYRQAVLDYLIAGRDDKDSALLWKVGSAELFMERGRQEWTRRYDARPNAHALWSAHTMAENGLLEFSSDPPRLGAEGAAYFPATAMAGAGSEPILVLGARGGSELVRGWASEAQMLEWVDERTTVEAGPLAAPPFPVIPRAWGEDTVLARLRHHPDEIAVTSALLPPDTFTTDVRYEVYSAFRALADRPDECTPDTVGGRIREQLRDVPEKGMLYYGGSEAPFVDQYLARLDHTYASDSQFRAAITALQTQDRRARETGLTVRAERPDPDAVLRPAPNSADGSPLEPPPGLGSSGQAGPVPGR